MVFEPVPASISPAWITPALLVGLTALLLTALAWPISALTRRHYGVTYGLAGGDAKAHRWVRIASAAVIAIFIVWAVSVTLIMGESMVSSTSDILLGIVQVLSAIVFFGAAGIGLVERKCRGAWRTQVVREDVGRRARARLAGRALGRAGVSSHRLRRELLRHGVNDDADADRSIRSPCLSPRRSRQVISIAVACCSDQRRSRRKMLRLRMAVA